MALDASAGVRFHIAAVVILLVRRVSLNGKFPCATEASAAEIHVLVGLNAQITSASRHIMGGILFHIIKLFLTPFLPSQLCLVSITVSPWTGRLREGA